MGLFPTLIVNCTYACRQYLQDRTLKIDFNDLSRVVGETWRSLTYDEKGPYEAASQQEAQLYAQEKQLYDELRRRYAELHAAATASGSLCLYIQCVLSGEVQTGNMARTCGCRGSWFSVGRKDHNRS